MQNLFLVLSFLTASFLILLVMIQRGKGGGLAGALGGMGGQSAFGTKAGDLFTKITIGVAGFWILLCAFIVWYLAGTRNASSSKLGRTPAPATATQSTEKDKGDQPADAKSAPAGDAKTAPASDAAPKGEQKTSDSKPASGAAAPATTTTPAAKPSGEEKAKK
jgi:preprotein translocase subunit SecG